MKNVIPEYIKPFLWSYDLSKIDLYDDKKRIITNVLNLGTKEATDWVFSTYGKKDIIDAVENPFSGEWNKKSLNFWSFIFDIKTNYSSRNIK